MLVRASSSCDVADSRLAMSMHFDEHELPPLAQLLADDRRRFRIAAVLVELLLEQRAVDREIRVDGQHVVARVIAGGLVVQILRGRALGQPQCLRVAQGDLARPRRMLRAPRAPHFTGVGRYRCELRSCVSEVPWSSGVGIAVARPHLVGGSRASRRGVRGVSRSGRLVTGAARLDCGRGRRPRRVHGRRRGRVGLGDGGDRCAVMLLGAVILAGREEGELVEDREAPRRRLLPRAVLALLAVVALGGVAVPMAGALATRSSHDAAAEGRLTAALEDSRTAERLRPLRGDAAPAARARARRGRRAGAPPPHRRPRPPTSRRTGAPGLSWPASTRAAARRSPPWPPCAWPADRAPDSASHYPADPRGATHTLSKASSVCSASTS